MTISEQLAQYIVNVRFEDIPEEVVHFTKLCIVDYYSSLLKGKEADPVQMMEQVALIIGGEKQATAVSGLKTSITNAAFINGGASHVIELDDIHKASIVHAATVIMPAAIAIAEWQNLSGKRLIEAIVVGYEVAFRIGETVTPSHYYYFHNTATCGTFGAAAAVAKLLDLSKAQIVQAFGSAGTQAAGLWEFIEDGAMSKQLHPGKAAMNGILSALLAQQGFTGATAILEGRRGFFEAMSDEYDITRMTDKLGEQYKITENAFKVHASCRHTHAAMDLAIELYEKVKNNGIDSIQSIEVGAYQVALDITDAKNPQTIYAAKFSMQFCVALALLTGKGGFDAFNADSLKNPLIRSLMEKMVVSVDEDIHSQYPHEWGAKIQIHWLDGTSDVMQSQFPKGDPENPLTEQDFIEKFNSLVPLEETHKEKIINQLLHLETLQVQQIIRTIHPIKHISIV
ncbi:MmgE/PrpD family protein [Solibacillus sp. FSL K6-4121]|uniref:MmgE/PrpD family protein n=1 Tax=Solibacillus sp. FSL K6-4121 TaxID=2921505 RepID=UPI0030F6A851